MSIPISFAADRAFGAGLKVLNPDAAGAYLAASEAGGPAWDRYFQYGPRDLRILYLTRRLAALRIDRGDYRRLFRGDVLAHFKSEFEALAAEGLVEVTPGAIRPTPRGMFYADSVAAVLARQQIQMQLGTEMGNWMMTGIVNDMRLDAFYDELTKAAKGGQ